MKFIALWRPGDRRAGLWNDQRVHKITGPGSGFVTAAKKDCLRKRLMPDCCWVQARIHCAGCRSGLTELIARDFADWLNIGPDSSEAICHDSRVLDRGGASSAAGQDGWALPEWRQNSQNCSLKGQEGTGGGCANGGYVRGGSIFVNEYSWNTWRCRWCGEPFALCRNSPAGEIPIGPYARSVWETTVLDECRPAYCGFAHTYPRTLGIRFLETYGNSPIFAGGHAAPRDQ